MDDVIELIDKIRECAYNVRRDFLPDISNQSIKMHY